MFTLPKKQQKTRRDVADKSDDRQIPATPVSKTSIGKYTTKLSLREGLQR